MFRNLVKEKQLIDRELQVYYNERKNEIDRKLIALETQCATDTAEFEHEYHHTMEERGIEIAKLEAQKEMLENDTNTYERLLKEKDKEIKRLQEVLLKLSENVGTKVVK